MVLGCQGGGKKHLFGSRCFFSGPGIPNRAKGATTGRPSPGTSSLRTRWSRAFRSSWMKEPSPGTHHASTYTTLITPTGSPPSRPSTTTPQACALVKHPTRTIRQPGYSPPQNPRSDCNHNSSSKRPTHLAPSQCLLQLVQPFDTGGAPHATPLTNITDLMSNLVNSTTTPSAQAKLAKHRKGNGKSLQHSTAPPPNWHLHAAHIPKGHTSQGHHTQ